MAHQTPVQFRTKRGSGRRPQDHGSRSAAQSDRRDRLALLARTRRREIRSAG